MNEAINVMEENAVIALFEAHIRAATLPLLESHKTETLIILLGAISRVAVRRGRCVTVRHSVGIAV